MKEFIFTINLMLIALALIVGAVNEETTAADTDKNETTTILEVTTAEYIPEQETQTEAITEPSVTFLEMPPINISYYDVNLPTEVQDTIFAECEKYNINPAIVIAMIERESRYNPNAIGDNGNSFGLMQIQPRWHSQRMAELGCTDLFNPEQNIRVGINYLAELKDRYGDITKALVAYNRGCYVGGITSYATEIIARANEL